MSTVKSSPNDENDDRRPSPPPLAVASYNRDNDEEAAIIATTIDTTATAHLLRNPSDPYYNSIPDVLAVIEMDYEKSAVFFKRAMWLCLAAAALEVVVAATACYDAPALLVFFAVSALVLARLAYLHRICFQLYAQRRIHMAVTREGIRQDLDIGQQLDNNAARSSVTIFRRFADMQSVTVSDHIPCHKQAFCLAPAGLVMMTIPLRTSSRRWQRPFRAYGIKSNSAAHQLEQLIRQRIQASTPIEAIAVVAVATPSVADHQQQEAANIYNVRATQRNVSKE